MLLKRLFQNRNMQQANILLFNVSIDTDNLGDQIIMKYVYEVLGELFPNGKCIEVPTHRPPTKEELVAINKKHLPIVFGTNIICPNVEKYNLWRMPEDMDICKNTLFAAVGMNSYGEVTQASKELYLSIASKKLLHSARDRYSAQKMQEMGLTNTLYTGCVTMWKLNEAICKEIPASKSDTALFTLTAHRATEHDQTMLDIIFKNYDKVYFWPQDIRDISYLDSLQYDSSKLTRLPRSLDAYEEVLNSTNLDYIGTRLHGGIHALNHKKRTIVIEVDNRAAEIGTDTGLPTIPRKQIEQLDQLVNSDFITKIEMPWENIEKWKAQFR